MSFSSLRIAPRTFDTAIEQLQRQRGSSKCRSHGINHPHLRRNGRNAVRRLIWIAQRRRMLITTEAKSNPRSKKNSVWWRHTQQQLHRKLRNQIDLTKGTQPEYQKMESSQHFDCGAKHRPLRCATQTTSG